MKLSDIKVDNAEYKIKRDGRFRGLGLLAQDTVSSDEMLGYIESPDYIDAFIRKQGFSSVVCSPSIAEQLAEQYDGGICVAEDVKGMFFMLHNQLAGTGFYREKRENSIASSARIHSSVVIPDHNIVIGENSEIHANVVLYPNTKIGDNTIVRESSVIGTPPFYYFGDENSMVIGAGGVDIEDNVEIHTNVSIQRGVFGGDTFIGEYAKIDNLVLVAHDAFVGRKSIITSSVTLSGSSHIEESVFLGVGVSVIPFKRVGRFASVGAGSVVTTDLEEHAVYCGVPAKYLRKVNKAKNE